MQEILEALTYLGQGQFWVFLVIGVLLSGVIGIVPGVGSLLVMAILIPFLLVNVPDPTIALVLLAAITGCGNTLDSLPAVVAGLPGSSTQVTFLEGHQLARQGKATHTLGAIYVVSAIGGVVGAIAMAIVVPIIRPFVLSFNYPEIAMVALFGVGMVAALSRGALIKGLTAALLGLLISTVGIDPFTGTPRFVFDRIELWEGLPLVATITGVFAIPEMLDLTMTRKPVAQSGSITTQREMFRGAAYGLSKWKEAIRQSLFGVFIGAIPGVGGSVIDWLAYAFGILWRKDKTEFGKGSLDGVLFAESAQNSKEAGQAIPTLALGIPGGTGWIMMIVAMMAYGISPGPEMLGVNAHITIVIIFTLGLGNLLITMIALVASRPMIKLTTIPYAAIAAVIVPLTILAGFMDMRNWFAIPVMLAFSVIGFLMKRFGWPRPPLVLGFILGPIIDRNLQAALSLMGPVGVLTRPLTIILFLFAIGTALAFYYFMGRTSNSPIVQAVGGQVPPPSGAAPDAPEAKAPVRFRLRLEALPTLALVIGAALFLITSLDYPARARMIPLWLSVGIIALGTLEFFRQTLRRTITQGDIMDLGMRSKGVEGATKTAAVFLGTLVLFLVLATIIGLQYAPIVFAVLLPLLLLEGKQRLIASVAAGAIISFWTLYFMNDFMAVIWPQPMLRVWLLGS
jgi:TctA family transporter